jgi:predicted CoA-binding protein
MKTVAVIGASSNRDKWGNKAIRAFLQQGYTVYPVNPNEPEVEGLKTYASIRDVPVRPQTVTVYLPPPRLVKILPDIAARGCDELFLNPGTESAEVLAECDRLGLNAIQRAASLPSAFRPRNCESHCLAAGSGGHDARSREYLTGPPNCRTHGRKSSVAETTFGRPP